MTNPVTIGDLEAEIERLKAKCNKQAMVLRRLFPERHADTFFICGAGGEKDRNGLPDRVMICAAYGSDAIELYERRVRS